MYKLNGVAKSYMDFGETYFVFFKILSTIHPIKYPAANTGRANTNAKSIAAITKIGNGGLLGWGTIENAYRNIITNISIELNNEILVILDLPHLARPAFFSVLYIYHERENRYFY